MEGVGHVLLQHTGTWMQIHDIVMREKLCKAQERPSSCVFPQVRCFLGGGGGAQLLAATGSLTIAGLWINLGPL
eukprot:3221267-Amphidinium_carterae.1